MASMVARVASDSEDMESTLVREDERLTASSRSLPLWAVAGVCLAVTVLGAFVAFPSREDRAATSTPVAIARPEAITELAANGDDYKSVMGGHLSSCSTAGTAMTGFTRDGHCVDSGDDDAGSHHICIQMKPDFCKVTGQPNWCVEKMECMDDPQKKCPIGNWCVCQWAFATYIDMAGGCDQIVDLKCNATNMAAFHAYQDSTEPSHKAALACIKKKCSLK
mmetsp:Transcript_39560/g.89221  ORF Transcript_39560/g.89221 Transcript_39560/m.89221 type:complete len:221 (-) Transcript_39560:254-916(-)